MRAVIVSALAVLLCLLSAVALVDARGPRATELTAQYTFDRYVQDFKKPYVRGSAEYDRRAALFKESLAGVLAHNADPKRTYSKGVNHMSDWSAAEFKAIRGARHSPDYKSANEKPFVKSGKVGAVPESVDWRGASPAVLTAVKDQGMCGDCWAHAVTEAVESAYARATGNLYALSQQQVTSCTPRVNSCFGCDGFYPKYAYDFVAGVDGKENATQGLVEEWVYSFSSWRGDSGVCNTTKTQMGKAGGLVTTVQITGFTQVPTNDEEAVMEAVATLGPLSILVDAMDWQQYESGVFTGCAAYDENFALDHAVMLVGYGHDAATSLDYWIVRNSWSAAWGENGYVRIAKSGKPACGDTWTLSCANQSYTTKACGPCGLLTDAQFPNVVEPTRRRL